MKDYEPTMGFDQEAFEIYGDPSRGDEDDAVAFLERHARGGPALELAIGTGRIGLPLAARGIRVDGLDLSEHSVALLRTKPGGADLDVRIADFADVDVGGQYRLIYVVFNTFFNLPSQDVQVRCFENVASHLTDDGVFVIEAGSPQSLFDELDNQQYVRAESIGVDHVRLDVLRNDPATQTLEEQHVHLTRGGIKFAPVVQRYAFPAELDLMARMAGLRFVERWDGWRNEPFSGTGNVVSVYGR